MASRQRRIVGAVLRVPLDDRFHAYAWTLPEVDFAFFDLRADFEVAIEEIVRHPIAFRIAIHKSAWTTGRWRRVGKVEPPPEVLAPVPTFIRDPFDGRFSIYLLGEIRPTTREECIGLERCAVWDPEHVEDRLRDHFDGVPNKWVRSLALDT
jgi:Immunity protein 26